MPWDNEAIRIILKNKPDDLALQGNNHQIASCGVCECEQNIFIHHLIEVNW